MGFLTAARALQPLRGNGSRNSTGNGTGSGTAERHPDLSADSHCRADAIDRFLKSRSKRERAIHDSVRLFRRCPKLRVFYVANPTLVYDATGWYSCIQNEPGPDDGGPQLTRGPFPSHLDARNAWLSR